MKNYFIIFSTTLLIGLVQSSTAFNNTIFFGQLEIPNGTNSTNLTAPQLNNLIGKKLECEILYGDVIENVTDNAASSVRDIIPANDIIYYNIENLTCLSLTILKPQGAFIEFHLDDFIYPEQVTGIEIYDVGINSPNYTISFLRFINDTKIFYDSANIPLKSNYSIDLWFNLIENRIEFGYDGNDQPLQTFYIKPKHFIINYTFYTNVFYIFKDTNKKCSPIRPTSQKAFTMCQLKNVTNNDDDNNNDNGNGNDNDNGNSNGNDNGNNTNCEPNHFISPFLHNLVYSLNYSLNILNEDDYVLHTIMMDQLKYLSKNGLNELAFRIREIYDNTQSMHNTIMQYIPQNESELNYKRDYLNNGIYLAIRRSYFQIYLKIQVALESSDLFKV